MERVSSKNKQASEMGLFLWGFLHVRVNFKISLSFKMGVTWLRGVAPTHKAPRIRPTFLPIPHLTTLTSKSCLKTPYFEFGFRFIFLGCYFVGLFGVLSICLYFNIIYLVV